MEVTAYVIILLQGIIDLFALRDNEASPNIKIGVFLAGVIFITFGIIALIIR